MATPLPQCRRVASALLGVAIVFFAAGVAYQHECAVPSGALTPAEMSDLRDAPASPDDQAEAVKSFFAQYGTVLEKLGLKTNGVWFLPDSKVTSIKTALASLVGADPANLQIALDPDTQSGRIGAYVVALSAGSEGLPTGYVLGENGKKTTVPQVEQKAVYVENGQKIPVIGYFEGDHKLMVGTDRCEGRLRKLRDLYGTISPSQIVCPGGKTLTVSGDTNGLTVDGSAAKSF